MDFETEREKNSKLDDITQIIELKSNWLKRKKLMKNTEIEYKKEKCCWLLLFLGYNSICIENMLNFYSHIEISSSFSDKLKELQSATDSSPTILYRLRFIERLLQCHGIGRTKRELKNYTIQDNSEKRKSSGKSKSISEDYEFENELENESENKDDINNESEKKKKQKLDKKDKKDKKEKKEKKEKGEKKKK